MKNNKIKKMNKKGFAYLITTSLILIVLVGVFLTSNTFRYQDQEETYQLRLRTTNDFVKNLNNDIHNAAYIAAFRTLLSLETHITTTGIFLNNTNESFRETFYYGTIDETPVALMKNSSFEDYLLRIKQIGKETGLLINMNVTEINLKQTSPWSIDVIVTIDVNVSEINKLASWEYLKNFTTQIPIYDLKDPLYGVFTQNKIPNTIQIFNKTPLVNGTDTEYLIELINSSNYLASNKSPNFLMRFENILTPDINGIESLVNIQVLSDQGLDVYPDRVKVDYIYFNDILTDKIFDVQNMDNTYFVIPCNRKELYNVSGLNYNSTC